MTDLEKQLLEKIKKSKANGRFSLIKRPCKKYLDQDDVATKPELVGSVTHDRWVGGWVKEEIDIEK